ncbi:mycofactocin-coupled SDR family oxidoreductase [Tomitella fengzijianii]|uniref:NAD(P)-dependent oxidoreductase n=1 Tax=Tomitella fengzijianii TaxID=2597660 RepID=A0A516X778_9ACTN|nr:mycofactocin-coupled SDR family oxidoreductase [Tomitella fengzijianii]QDQ98924.1 NAD(P)-dependent oxidoreductase [Tomitella fengzijianii]
MSLGTDRRLAGKVALVTGAGAGMGLAFADRLAAGGADIIAVDLDEAGLDAAARSVREHGRGVVTFRADVREQAALDEAVRAGVDRFGGLDAVVANAGVSRNPGPSWTIDEAEWDLAVGVNVTGAWHTVKAGVPALAERGGGSVILISSTAGIKSVPGASQYSAAKHAVIGLMRTLANELGGQSIRVNAVLPGAVNTAMTNNPATFARLRPDLENPGPEDVAGVLAARHLLPIPWAEPEDVANAVAFLTSDESRCITGQQIVVDAGLTQKVA